MLTDSKLCVSEAQEEDTKEEEEEPEEEDVKVGYGSCDWGFFCMTYVAFFFISFLLLCEIRFYS